MGNYLFYCHCRACPGNLDPLAMPRQFKQDARHIGEQSEAVLRTAMAGHDETTNPAPAAPDPPAIPSPAPETSPPRGRPPADGRRTTPDTSSAAPRPCR